MVWWYAFIKYGISQRWYYLSVVHTFFSLIVNPAIFNLSKTILVFHFSYSSLISPKQSHAGRIFVFFISLIIIFTIVLFKNFTCGLNSKRHSFHLNKPIGVFIVNSLKSLSIGIWWYVDFRPGLEDVFIAAMEFKAHSPLGIG